MERIIQQMKTMIERGIHNLKEANKRKHVFIMAIKKREEKFKEYLPYFPFKWHNIAFLDFFFLIFPLSSSPIVVHYPPSPFCLSSSQSYVQMRLVFCRFAHPQPFPPRFRAYLGSISQHQPVSRKVDWIEWLKVGEKCLMRTPTFGRKRWPVAFSSSFLTERTALLINLPFKGNVCPFSSYTSLSFCFNLFFHFLCFNPPIPHSWPKTISAFLPNKLLFSFSINDAGYPNMVEFLIVNSNLSSISIFNIYYTPNN